MFKSVEREELAFLPDDLMVVCEDIPGTAKEIREFLGIKQLSGRKVKEHFEAWF